MDEVPDSLRLDIVRHGLQTGAPSFRSEFRSALAIRDPAEQIFRMALHDHKVPAGLVSFPVESASHLGVG